MLKQETYQPKGFFGWVEKWGNKIPHAAYLFIWMSVIVLIFSFILSKAGMTVQHPTTGKEVAIVNLLTSGAIATFLQNMGSVWMNFAPMLTVPICTLGLGVANHSGMLPATLKLTGSSKSKWIATLIVAFVGVNANIVGDASGIIFPPLIAILFMGLGRNPLAGLFLGYSSRSVGFGANLLMGSADASLAGLTQEAAVIINPDYVANPAMGWYFLFASTFVLTVVCAAVNLLIVEPKLDRMGLGKDASAILLKAEDMEPLTPQQLKGLKVSLISLILFFVAVAALTLPGLPFAAPEGGSLLSGALFKSIPTLIFLMFYVMGFSYGKVTGSVKSFGSTIPMMTKEISSISSFFLVSFFSSQFIALFTTSQIATVIAINGGSLLQSLQVPSIVLMILFVFMVAFINMFMSSANGKWGLLAAVFVPMFMIAGIDPAFTQVAYRIGDSLTNNLAPTSATMAVVLGYAAQYDKKAGFGTCVAYMMPYSLVAALVWIIFMVLWVFIGLPMGPGYGPFL